MCWLLLSWKDCGTFWVSLRSCRPIKSVSQQESGIPQPCLTTWRLALPKYIFCYPFLSLLGYVKLSGGIEFGLLFSIQAVLKQHYSDDPKLAYTGEPIVKWPERVSRVKKINDFALGSVLELCNFTFQKVKVQFLKVVCAHMIKCYLI